MKAPVLSGQVEILLPAALNHGFDYQVPPGMTLEEGAIVGVPFGKGESLGVVWGQGKAQLAAGKAQLAAGKIKPVAKHYNYPPLPAQTRAFIDWAAWYNCAPKGALLKMALPITDIDKTGRVRYALPSYAQPESGLATLSAIQQHAATTLRQQLDTGFSVTLLDGVTGSGKTEVYFSAIAAVLSQSDGQCLVLLPEIALSVQWLERFEMRFGFQPVVWHSNITHAQKRAGWQAIARGEARIIVGARSALFLPYKQLALLIVDEEHDSSYKQEEGVIYHARDMAVARARFERIPTVLVSATPSLESYYNARQGKYTELALPLRHGGAELPDIEMIDMREQTLERDTFISPPLRDALANALAHGHQAMLFLNRRGYAPLMLCRACGHRFQCPHCSAWMVTHKKKGKKDDFSQALLRCHHCDYHIPVPKTCPACMAEDKLHPCGPGVERVAQEVGYFLPQARVAIMASDSTDNARQTEDIIHAMQERRVDVLIGTQMIAKGHHFADLAVVGVVDADLGLAGGDLRAAERTYQLLHQLSGRAGREQVKGRVYLQSFLPEHPVMKALLSGERNAFLEAELNARKRARMPPFSRLAALIIEGVHEDQVIAHAKKLAAFAPAMEKLQVMGPAPAPLYLLRGKFRYRLLVQAERSVNLPDTIQDWVKNIPTPNALKVKIDIDPISFL